MNVYETLESIRKLARDDPMVRERILETANASCPLKEFCRLCGELGYPVSAMDLISAGEEDYAAMKRSTNGGGENSPMLDGADDYYGMFLAEI